MADMQMLIKGFWRYSRAQLEKTKAIKVCGRNPKDISQQCKTLPCIDFLNVTITFEHVWEFTQ